MQKYFTALLVVRKYAVEIKNSDKHVVGGFVIKKEYQHKKPEHKSSTYKKFSKRW